MATQTTFNGMLECEIIRRNWKRNPLLRVAVERDTVYHWKTLEARSKQGSGIRAYAVHKACEVLKR